MVAFVFPGQGSQTVGMGQDLYDAYPAARRVLDECAAAVDFPLLSLMFEGPEEELRNTENAQPALLAHSAAATAALTDSGLEPDVVAGHSLGEYSAVVAAGCLDPTQGVRLVRQRGLLMAEVGEHAQGAMAAVLGLDEDRLQEVVDEASRSGVVCLANLNTAEQIVISGETEAVAKASKLATEAGAKRVIPLNVSGAFHSPLMEPVAQRFADVLAEVDLRDAEVPVVSNVDASPRLAAEEIRRALVAQLTSPVLWDYAISRMLSMGASDFVEVGPGKVLANMLRRRRETPRTFRAGDREGIEETLGALQS